MPTLAQVRQQHPEYADLNDQQLADGLYKKFYSDLPRAQFDAKVGLRPAAQAKPPVAAWVDAHVANDKGLLGDAFRAMRSSVQAKAAIHDQRQATPAPSVGALLDVPGEIGGAVSGAWKRLKGDVTNDYQTFAQESRQPGGQTPMQSLGSYGRTARMVGDVAGLITSPVAGAAHAIIVRPTAKALSVLPGVSYGDAEQSVTTALMGLPPEGGLIGRTSAAARVGTASGAARMVARRATPLTDTIAQFDQAGVRPSLVAARASDTAPITKAISENAIAGARARRHMAGQISDVQQAAGRSAQAYGTPLTRQGAGQAIREGVESFANGDAPTSFSAKAGKLYDGAFSGLDAAMAGKTDVGSSQISTRATQGALHDMTDGVAQSKPIADLIKDPKLVQVAAAVKAGTQDMSFQDLRALRTWVRTSQQDPVLRQSVGAANLQRLEGALTDDIYANASSLGSPQLLHQLQRADDFYRTGMGRINDRLNAVFKAKSDESAYDMLHKAAQDAGGADIAKLTALKRSLGPDWGDVAATMVDRLGKAKPGAVMGEEDPFSIANFVTNYAKLSDAGRETVFGARAGGGAQASRLKRELDNLVQVAGKMKGVEAAANNSKSGVSVQNLASAGGLLNPATTIPTATGLSGLAITGEIMTNPAAVRLLAKMLEAKTPAQAAQVQSGLKVLAQKSPGSASQLERYWRATANVAGYGSENTLPPTRTATSPVGTQ